MARLTGNHVKEHLSLAYIKALIAMGRYTYSIQNIDTESIDIQIHAESRFPCLGLQLKATASPKWIEGGAKLSFSLSKKNYNDLSDENRANPAYLAVLVLPADEACWCCVNADSLVLRYNMYWLSLEGFPAIDTDSCVIHLPRENILDSRTIANWFTDARRYVARR